MTEHNEVSTKLTLDDHASEALHHVREGFEKVGERVHETAHELVGMAKQAAAVAIGFQLNGMIESLHELGHEMLESAAHLEDQKKGLAGMISLADKGESSMEELGEKAEKLNERFETLGITVGVSKDQLIDAFDLMAERSTRGTEHAAEMTEKMAQAARVLPGGITTLASAFRDLESGVVRPKNAIVQLMRQTGVAAGTAKSIAKGVNALFAAGKSEKVMGMAEEAIARMGEKMKKVPQSFSEIMVSLKGFREMFIETLGTPALRALVPHFESLKQYLVTHRQEIEHFAHTMGEKVGIWATKAAEMMRDGFQYVSDHADEIFKALEGGAKALKGAIAFMVEHKTLLMGLATAKFASGLIGSTGGKGGPSGMLGMIPGLGTAAGQMVGAARSQIAASPTVAAIGGGWTAGIGAIGVLAWMEAAKQADQLEKETGLSTLATVKHMFQIGGGLQDAVKHLSTFDAEVRKLAASATDVSVATDDMEHFIHQMERAGEAAVEAGDMTRAAFERSMEAARQQAETHAKLSDQFQRMQDVSSQMGTGFGMMSGDRFAAAYREMADGHEKEATDAARRILTANDNLVKALGALGVEDALDRLKKMASGESKDGVKLPSINFGPSRFTIHQDFRDQDPDRVAIVFRKDVTKHAVSRVGARTGSPFGF